MRTRTRILRQAVVLLSVLVELPGGSAWSDEGASLKSVWNVSSTSKPLKSWSLPELKKVRSASQREDAFGEGKAAHWKGAVISKFVEQALQELPLEQRASVDLLVLRSAAGKEALIPRSLVTHYPLLLAYQKDGKPLEGPEGPFAVVVPITSNPKITQEGLPLSAYALSGVIEIEFASYQSRYSGLFLKRRTDPAAIRGEKMYVQTCIGCHGAGRAKSLSDVTVSANAQVRTVASALHPPASGAPRLTERDLRALVSYLEAFRAESQSVSLIPSQTGGAAIRKQ